MKKIIFSLFWGALAPLLAIVIRLILPGIIIAYFFCDIAPTESYSFLGGIWHGIFIPVNMIRGIFFDVLYKAELYTTAYNVIWWIFAVLWIFSILCIIWQLIKDTVLCYKHGPQSLQ